MSSGFSVQSSSGSTTYGWHASLALIKLLLIKINKNAKTNSTNYRLPLVHLPFYSILGPHPCFTLCRKTTKSAKKLAWVGPNSMHRFSNQETGFSFFGNRSL